MTEPYDVAIVTDCRLPGGTAASVAEEVRAQAGAGLTSALVHVESALVARPRGFNPRLAEVVDEGLADVAAAGAEVAARLAVLRHPGVLASARGALPRVQADRAVGVINQPPWDAPVQQRYYDLDAARRFVAEHVDPDAVWVPIGPQVREQLTRQAPDLELLAEDWVNVIDVDRWAVDPDLRFRGPRLVVGRHSRPDARKWPADAESLLAAYPDERWLDVRVLGGAEPAQRVLGRLPASWTVLPFGARPVDRFLAELDAFVYFHHPAWVEAFGRTVLEALASGTVVVLPEHLAGLFGDLAITTDVARVPTVLAELRDDPDAARARARRGQELTRERFGHGEHQRRLAKLLDPAGAPARETEATTASQRAEVRRGDGLRRRRVLVVAVDGDGTGGLTALREVAVTRDIELVTLQPAAVDDASETSLAGVGTVEVLPPHLAELTSTDRQRLLAERIGDLIDELDITGLVVLEGAGPAGAEQAHASPASAGDLPAACLAALRTRPQVVMTSWDPLESIGPDEGAAGDESAAATFERLSDHPVRSPAGSGGWRVRLRLSAKELAAQVLARLPRRAREVAGRFRSRAPGGPARLRVPAADMLSPGETEAAAGVAVVLRDQAGEDDARATVAALRRHQLVHRDVRPLLVVEAGTELDGWTLGYPIEVLPDAACGLATVTRRRRRLALLRSTYDVADVIVLEGTEDLEDPVVRSSLVPQTSSGRSSG